MANYYVYDMGEESFRLMMPLTWVIINNSQPCEKFWTQRIVLKSIDKTKWIYSCCRMPFSWKTPFGYVLTLIFEIIIDFIVVSIYVPNITYFIGLCWLLISIFDIDSPTLYAPIDCSTADIISNTKPYAGKQLKANFLQLVHFYSDAKELSSSVFIEFNSRRTEWQFDSTF